MRKTLALLSLALLGSCHHLLPGLRGPEFVKVRLKPQDQAPRQGRSRARKRQR